MREFKTTSYLIPLNAFFTDDLDVLSRAMKDTENFLWEVKTGVLSKEPD